MPEWRRDPRWHLFSEHGRQYDIGPKKRPPPAAERSGDGNWATVWAQDEQGRMVATEVYVLLEADSVKRYNLGRKRGGTT